MADSDTRWAVACVAPLVAYLLLGAFEPKFAGDQRFSRAQAAGTTAMAPIDSIPQLSKSALAKSNRYLIFVGLKLLVVGGMLVYFSPVYRQILPRRGAPRAAESLAARDVHQSPPDAPHGESSGAPEVPAQPEPNRTALWSSCLVGAVGFLAWIGLCQAGLEHSCAVRLGLADEVAATRSHFDPFIAFPSAAVCGLFLISRFLLLVVIVPLAEELFLRGFLIRFLQNPDWTKQDFTHLAWGPLAAATGYGVLTHPAEAIAAAAWFSLVSWWMVRTGSFWNCVLVHAVTNGLLGGYVLAFHAWHLW